MPRYRFLMLLVTLLAAGCGSSYATVTGTVTLDGTPLETGSVTFFVSDDNGPAASGGINSGGRYSLSVGSTPGLPPGEYIAIVVATGQPDKPGDYGKSLVPPNYMARDKSDLKFTVKPGSNTIDLPLKSKK